MRKRCITLWWHGLINSKQADANVSLDYLNKAIIFVGEKLSWLFLISVVVSVVEVVLRYVFNAPTIWAHETTILFCALCFVYGGAHCLAEDRHIRINVVYDLLSPRLRIILDYLSLILCAIYLAAMSYGAWFVALSSLFGPSGNWQLETSGSAWDPAFPAIVRCFLFIVLVLMCLQTLLQLYQRIMRKRHA